MIAYITGAYGQQIKTLSVESEESALLNTREGETAVYVAPPSEHHWWDGEQWQGRGESPSPSHLWDNQTHTWYLPAVPEVDIEALKQAKWEAIKTLRSAAEQAPVFVNGSWFDADALSLQRIQGTIQYVQLTGSGTNWSTIWTTADNKPVTITVNTIIAVGVAIGEQVMAVHAYSRTLRAAVEAATTEAELEVVVWAYEPVLEAFP